MRNYNRSAGLPELPSLPETELIKGGVQLLDSTIQGSFDIGKTAIEQRALTQRTVIERRAKEAQANAQAAASIAQSNNVGQTVVALNNQLGEIGSLAEFYKSTGGTSFDNLVAAIYASHP